MDIGSVVDLGKKGDGDGAKDKDNDKDGEKELTSPDLDKLVGKASASFPGVSDGADADGSGAASKAAAAAAAADAEAKRKAADAEAKRKADGQKPEVDVDQRLLGRLAQARAIGERMSAGGSRTLRMLLLMPLLLASAAVVPIVAAGKDVDEGEDGEGEGFANAGEPGSTRRDEGFDVAFESALAAAGVAAVGLLLPTGRAGPVALWVSVVVPLWLVSLVVQRKRALRAPA